ncbi:hypothetical protein Cfor_02791 [Coptotermes formosanus]|uniref:Uncharacterized protein n=1 Tax=Coptotermes formosanus TaxID=36987 RepID=A0A6L2PBU5_COPFO|nr:hypothetical protein Cfor_02791 [Coptotermes formosanus]
MVAFLPYVQKTSNHISRIPTRHSQDLQPPSFVKDDLELKKHGERPLLAHPAWTPDKSAVTEQRFNHHHHTQVHDTTILCTKFHYMDQIMRDVIETELHSNNMSRWDGLI